MISQLPIEKFSTKCFLLLEIGFQCSIRQQVSDRKFRLQLKVLCAGSPSAALMALRQHVETHGAFIYWFTITDRE